MSADPGRAGALSHEVDALEWCGTSSGVAISLRATMMIEVNTPLPIRRRQLTVALLMLAFSVMSYFNRTIMSIAGPSIVKEFVLSETALGSVFSAFLLSYAVLMIPGGYLADRYGPRLILAGMGLGSALFTGLTAVAGEPGLGTYLGIVPSFLMMRFGMGLFTAPLYPSCARMNANWFRPLERARVWGLISAGAGVGGATSPLLFSWMMGRYGWRQSFWISASATAALAILWLWLVRDHPSRVSVPASANVGPRTRRQPPALSKPWRRLLTNRSLMWLTLGYSTVGYFEYIFFFWIYYYFSEVRQMGADQSAIYTTALFLTWMLLTPMGGWISDRLVLRYGKRSGRRLVPLVCLTSSAAMLCVGVNLSGTLSVATLLSLALGFAAATDGPFWATAIDLGGSEAGTASGIMNTGANVGGFIAPILTPWLASFIGWSGALYCSSAIVLTGVVCWFFIDLDSSVDSPGADITTLQSLSGQSSS
ncbi:MAG: MFS transporter [Acidobacteriota bacterium]